MDHWRSPTDGVCAAKKKKPFPGALRDGAEEKNSFLDDDEEEEEELDFGMLPGSPTIGSPHRGSPRALSPRPGSPSVRVP